MSGLSLSHGFFVGEWQKSPIAFGVSSALIGRKVNSAIPAGASELLSGAVPVGEIWVITHAGITYAGTSPSFIYFQIDDGVTVISVYNQASPVSGVLYPREGQWIIPTGGQLRMATAGGTAGDTTVFEYCGYIIDTDQ
jgi:hypothetical protein